MAETRTHVGTRCSLCRMAATQVFVRPGFDPIPVCEWHLQRERAKALRGEPPTPNCASAAPRPPLGRMTGADRNG